MCQVHPGTYVALLAPEKTDYQGTRLATQKRLPRSYYTWYFSLRIRTSDSSQLEKEKRKGRTENKIVLRMKIKRKRKGMKKIREKKRKQGWERNNNTKLAQTL